MLMLLKSIAIISAAMFAGAALYINIAEHPARMELDTRFAAAQWAPSYRRATWMQAPLALLSLVAGLGSWLLGGEFGAAAETRALLEHWAKLHAVRTVLSFAATVLYVCLAV
jgi:hypothetical protein